MELITHLRSLVEELQVKIVKAKELSSYYGNAKDQQGNDMIKIEKILGESLAKFHSFNNIINDIWKHIQLVSGKHKVFIKKAKCMCLKAHIYMYREMDVYSE